MICKHCGETIPDGLTFCPECGGLVKDEQETSSI